MSDRKKPKRYAFDPETARLLEHEAFKMQLGVPELVGLMVRERQNASAKALNDFCGEEIYPVAEDVSALYAVSRTSGKQLGIDES